MATNVRYWGGPACGKTCQVEDWAAQSGMLRVRVMPKLRAVPSEGNSLIAQEWGMGHETFHYERSNYRDSSGLPVFMMRESGKWLFEHFNEMHSEFYMNKMREPKALIVPRVVWFEFNKEIFSNPAYMTTLPAPGWNANGDTYFRGMKIVFGDETKMLVAPPLSPWPTPTERPERNEEEWRAQYEGSWDMAMPGVDRTVFRGYGQPRRVREGEANPSLLTATEIMITLFRRIAQNENLNGVPEDMPRAPVHVPGERRNRTTISSSGGKTIFRLIFENGPKLTQERKDRLHMQYKQSIKNWGMQFIENSDLL